MHQNKYNVMQQQQNENKQENSNKKPDDKSGVMMQGHIKMGRVSACSWHKAKQAHRLAHARRARFPAMTFSSAV